METKYRIAKDKKGYIYVYKLENIVLREERRDIFDTIACNIWYDVLIGCGVYHILLFTNNPHHESYYLPFNITDEQYTKLCKIIK